MRRDIIYIIIILLLILAGFIGYNVYENKVENLKIDKKSLIIKNDRLDSISKGRYHKLVADTLKMKELEKEKDSLFSEVNKGPKVVTKIETKPVFIEKPIETVDVSDSLIKIEDYYPKKEDFYIKYKARINRLTGKETSKWDFNKTEIDILITENKDGTFSADAKLPDYITLGKLDILTTPKNKTKDNDFGIIMGVGAGLQFENDNYYSLNPGIRYKKFYLLGSFNTNNSLGVSVGFEF